MQTKDNSNTENIKNNFMIIDILTRAQSNIMHESEQISHVFTKIYFIFTFYFLQTQSKLITLNLCFGAQPLPKAKLTPTNLLQCQFPL